MSTTHLNKSEKGNTKDKFALNGMSLLKSVESPKKEKLVNKSINESKNTTGIKSNFRIENDKNKKDGEDKIIVPGGSSFE